VAETIKKCSRCGKDIIWGYTPKDKQPHPFDAKPTLVKTEDDPPKVIWARISHFVTCNRFANTTKKG
jgi:hypothetical protein